MTFTYPFVETLKLSNFKKLALKLPLNPVDSSNAKHAESKKLFNW